MVDIVIGEIGKLKFSKLCSCRDISRKGNYFIFKHGGNVIMRKTTWPIIHPALIAIGKLETIGTCVVISIVKLRNEIEFFYVLFDAISGNYTMHSRKLYLSPFLSSRIAQVCKHQTRPCKSGLAFCNDVITASFRCRFCEWSCSSWNLEMACFFTKFNFLAAMPQVASNR